MPYLTLPTLVFTQPIELQKTLMVSVFPLFPFNPVLEIKTLARNVQVLHYSFPFPVEMIGR